MNFIKLILVGLNHETTPIQIREQIAFSNEDAHAFSLQLQQQTEVEGTVILSTCNRTEVYCTIGEQGNIGEAIHQIINQLCQFKQVKAEQLEGHLYRLQEEQAIRHLISVASGLNSMVLGEPQIFGQVKEAFKLASELNIISPLLRKLFNWIFRSAKAIRNRTQIAKNPVTIPYATTHLIKNIYDNITLQKFLFIGAGEMIQLCSDYLYQLDCHQMTFCNRNPGKAETLAKRYQAGTIPLDHINEQFTNYDIIISCTASSHPILIADKVQQALKNTATSRHILLIDLAVPRDIEPTIATFNKIFLYCIDDLLRIIDTSKKKRLEAAEQAKTIIEAEIAAFYRSLHIERNKSTIIQFREQTDKLTNDLIDEAIQQLSNNQPPEQVIQRFAHQLKNKLQHQPTIALRNAVETDDTTTLNLLKSIYLPKNPKQP